MALSLNKHEPEIYLRPCPFCGSHHIDPEGVMTGTDKDNPIHKRAPACDDCGASTTIFLEPEKSFAAWNRRELYDSKI